jgi:hypothetical protein
LVRLPHVVRLRAADAAVPDLVIGETGVLQVWGVVTHAIKPLQV